MVLDGPNGPFFLSIREFSMSEKRKGQGNHKKGPHIDHSKKQARPPRGSSVPRV
ncbi:MAG TPA: hypothetical protein VHO23_03370 [Candidatus Paceibacterota bacterium]|nr:hypothetical protein [Candidatus Paceibacterota bacterium]